MSKPSRRASRGTPRPGGRPLSIAGAPATTGRTPGTRAGRRERPRYGYADRSFFQRYRGPIVAVAVVAAVALIGLFAFQSATAKTWTCATVFNPSPTPSLDPSASPDLGYVQSDMGANHRVTVPQEYAICPPASGNHYNAAGRGPIPARVYGPDDFAEPAGWTHNLEHGAMILLYRGQQGDPGLTDEGQEALEELFRTFPNSPICNVPPGEDGPVIARFDDMATPYAALVWGRVLPMSTFDSELVKQFWLLEGDRTNPELHCTPPSPSPAPPASVAPSGSAAPSGSVAPSGSAAPSGSVAPSGSAAPASASPAAS